MIHVFSSDSLVVVLLVDVVEARPPKHAEEEIEVDERDGDVRRRGGVPQ